jgi:hypothetical protein
LLVKPQHLDNRRANTYGVIGGFLQHGVYWVSHDDIPGKPIAIYGFTEFELEPRSRFEREDPFQPASGVR